MKSMIMLMVALLLSLSTWARVPDEAFLFSFNVRTLTSVESRDAKILDALELIREVFASEEFKKRVLSHRFSGKRAFAENRGLSNRQIYKSILAGAEKLSDEVDHVMDLDI